MREHASNRSFSARRRRCRFGVAPPASFSARRRLLFFAAALISAGMAVLALAPPAHAASANAAPTGPPRLLRGYPVLLSAGSDGGVWYGGYEAAGGEEVQASESAERIDYITPDGRFRDFPFPQALRGRWPQYLAAGRNGEEWFLTGQKGAHSPMLGEISPQGRLHAHVLAVDPHAKIRGLAIGPRGDLWMTEVLRRGHGQIGAILRVSPKWKLTTYRHGLSRGARPESITAGPHGVMWFLDAAGRIGLITASGVIHEVPIGRRIVPSVNTFGPSRPIIATPAGEIWFLPGKKLIGRFTPSHGVRYYRPRSSFHGREAEGERGALIGLALAPDGQVWFTRISGEVARIDRQGRVRTVTNRLVQAYGIAFANDGRAWVGESPRNVPELPGAAETPARVASITPAGRVRQYPPRPACRVHRVIGLGIGLPSGVIATFHRSGLRFCAARVRVGGVTIRHDHRHGPLIAVAQHPRPGTPVRGYMRVHVIFRRVPTPRRCNRPRYFRVRLATPHLLIWRVLLGKQEETEFSESLYACVRPHGRVHLMAEGSIEEDENFSGVSGLRAAGSFVAYTSWWGDQYGGSASLSVFDAGTGKNMYSITTSPFSGPGIPEGVRPPKSLARLGAPIGLRVLSFAVDRHGDLAWVELAESPTQPRRLVLYLHDHHGLRKLEVASHIEAIAFKGAALTWTSEGASHTTAVTAASR